MVTPHIPAYRNVVREVAKASVSPRATRNEAISRNFRDIFQKNIQDKQSETFHHDIQNAITFMRSQRLHKELLDRYNPLFDLTGEERIEATARRVGFNMPKTSTPPEEKSD
ncbi:hypothetical protein EWM64_g173 [Hericium alpestre]|uniref:Uncharacterized protein n=1 Tax=Hericium alpestre TaxID=135208 RepID=A0A4Z0ABT0_9AGAM|nr:hypothetical protein EWM64_g173 [Hericium alpestre]